MNSDLPVSADALLAERARLEEELQASEDWRELLRLKSRKDRGEPMSAVNAARLELVLIDALSQDATFVRYKSVCVALERLIRGLPPFPEDAADEAPADDDLTKIRGITPSMARRLNALDVTSFAQIAAWRGDDIRYISSELGIGKQINDQGWVAQAARLAGLQSDPDQDRATESRAEPPRDVPRAMPAARPPIPAAKEPPPAEARTHNAPLSVVPAKPAAVDAVSAPPAAEAKGESRVTPAPKRPEPVEPARAPETARPAASSNVTPLVPQGAAAEPEQPVAQPEAPKPSPAAVPPPRPVAVEAQPAPPPPAPSFDASLLKPPRPLIVTRASVAHLRTQEPTSVPAEAAVSAAPADDTRKTSPPPAPGGEDGRAPALPPKLPPATAAVLDDGASKAPPSMSIAEAIAYATEVAQRKEKPDVQPVMRVAPPPSAPPSPPPPVQSASPRKDVPAPPKPSPAPAPKRPAAPSPAVGANGAGRSAVAPPPLPADYRAKAEEPRGADAESYSGQDVGFSKGEIEEATVEIVHKGPAQMPTPRMVIRAPEREESSDTGRAATPIGRFLKALTGNQG